MFRYKNIPKKFDEERIKSFYDSDIQDEVKFLEEKFEKTKYFSKDEHKSILKKFRARFKRAPTQ